jgi:hypothetical protein
MNSLLKKNVISSKEITMVAPLVGLAVGAAARAVAKKVGQEAVKKAAKSATKSTAKALKAVNKPTDKTAKVAAKVEKKALKAANKPTKASKTFIGSNNNLSPSVRRDVIVNQTKPARPNRERGGSLKTLRKQGKTGNK